MNMKKKLRGLVCLWLAVLLLATTLPMGALATRYDGTVGYYYTDGESYPSEIYTDFGTYKVLHINDVSNHGLIPVPVGQHFSHWSKFEDSGFVTGYAHPNYHGGETIPEDATTTYFTLNLSTVWAKNTYNVVFHGNGATGGETAGQGFTYDEEKPLNGNGFVREFAVTFDGNGGNPGYTSAPASADFTGWATTPDGAVSYTDAYTVKNLSAVHKDTVNLYACWSPVSSVILPHAFRENADFDGWYTAPDGGEKVGNQGDSFVPETSLTLYAHWTERAPAVCTVTFVANGGSGTMEPQIFAPGVEQALAFNAFVRDGYTFAGWNSAADGSGTAYTEQESLSLNTDLILYAQWSENSSSISPDGAEPEPAPEPEPTPKPEPTPDPAPAPAPVPESTPAPAAPSRPVVQRLIVPISGDDKTILVDGTLSGKIATIPTVVPEQLDTVIDVQVKTGIVRIDFSKTNRQIDAVKIPTDALEQIAAAAADPENDTEGIEILFAEGMSIRLDAAALAAVVDQAEDDLITFHFGKAADLTDLQKKAIVGQTAYDIRITSEDKPIRDLGGTVTIQVPCVLKAGEKAEDIAVSYVDENGKELPCESAYDPEQKSVSWVTDHLSVYMVNARKTASEETYTVQKGDTLYSISQQFGCTVEDIMEHNGDLLGLNSQLIYEGWQLRIPAR